MPRRRRGIIKWQVTISEELAARVEQALMATTDSPHVPYGARTDLLERLLRNWLRDLNLQVPSTEPAALSLEQPNV